MVFETPKKREKRVIRRIDRFLGENTSTDCKEGYLTDSQNLSADAFPALATASSPKLYKDYFELGNPYSVGADEKLFYNDGNNFIYDGSIVGRLDFSGKKKFATLNDTVLIFPDRLAYSHKTKYYHFSYTGLRELTKTDGITHLTPLVKIGETAPKKANEGEKYYNTSTNKVNTFTNGAWIASDPLFETTYSVKESLFFSLLTTHIFTTLSGKTLRFETTDAEGNSGNSHIKITFMKDGEERKPDLTGFKVGDLVTFRGIYTTNLTVNKALLALSDGTTICALEPTYMIVENVGRVRSVSQNLAPTVEKVTMTKIIPPFDTIVSVGNRVWGAVDNMIYACAPDDPTEWSRDNGAIILDAHNTHKIIGSAELAGMPVFFTDNSIIKVYTVYNGYRLSIIPAPGLKEDSFESIAYVSGAIYYVSDSGIMCYSGNQPKKITFNSADKIKGAIGASDGVRYYLAFKEKLYEYDPQSDTWHYRMIKALSMASFGSSIAALGEVFGQKQILLIQSFGERAPVPYPILHFAPWDTDIIEKKTYHRLYLELENPGEIPIYVDVDYGNNRHSHHTINASKSPKLYRIELKAERCDNINVKIYSSSGNFTLKSIAREFTIHEASC